MGLSPKAKKPEEMSLPIHLQRRVLQTLACVFVFWQGSSVAQNTTRFEVPTTADVCYTRSINYIEPGLPSQCHRNSWPGASQTVHSVETDELSSPTHVPNSSGDTTADRFTVPNVAATDLAHHHTYTPAEEDNVPRKFVSFEDWKDQRAREASQEGLPDGSEQGVSSGSGEQDDGEEGLALRVEAVSGQINNIAAAASNASPTPSVDQDQPPDTVLYDEDKAQYYRSKDAGKTCKERFSYSSFDAGATVLKTNPGAKNPKAILVENKDSYMLLECAAKNKFAIVELTDDILIDTVVLANYEFFSSMVRQFRVSVSDRYPVKLDKWKVLGTFEAKNSRDTQPFLVENPMIWAKYVRIEFLSHYGNEYYCPVSLLRVHGTRMLDSWKDTEVMEEDDHERLESASQGDGEISMPEDIRDTQDGSRISTEHVSRTPSNEISMDPRYHVLLVLRPASVIGLSCSISSTITTSAHESPSATSTAEHTMPVSAYQTSSVHVESSTKQQAPADATARNHVVEPADSTVSRSTTPATSASSLPQPRETKSAGTPQAAADIPLSSPNSTGTSKTASASPSIRSRNGTSTSSTPASPTVQESFHKTVSKRLQLLETNVTLSLRYLEDQSRILQESQHLAERKQLAKVDSFLGNLNGTVLSELRNIRQQYDQIWQSTVIAIEGQKEQSQRELLALSSRLNLLAEEVVFQKRMAIVQAVLLLSCLVLVIFSRAASGQPPAIVHIPPTTSQLLQPRAIETSAGPSGRGGSEPSSLSRHDRQPVARQRRNPNAVVQGAAVWDTLRPSSLHDRVGGLDHVPQFSASLAQASGDARAGGSTEQVEALYREERGGLLSTDIATEATQNLSPPASPNTADVGVRLQGPEAISSHTRHHSPSDGELLPRNSQNTLPSLPEGDGDE